jgi:hypothetical protein
VTAIDPTHGELKTHLSPSALDSVDICLRRAAYNRRKSNPRRSGEARAAGTAYHAGLEYIYNRFKDAVVDPGFYTPPMRASVQQAAFEALDEEAATEGFEWSTSPAETRERVAFMLDSYANGGHVWSPDDYEVLGVEYGWDLPLPGVEGWRVKGFMDLVVREHRTGDIIIIDQKTSGKKWPQTKHLPHRQNQAPLYVWAWWQITGERPAYFAFDVMTYKGDFERRRCDVEDRHIKVTLEKAIGVSLLFQSTPIDWMPGNPTSNLCSDRFCDFYGECPFGAAAVENPPAGHVYLSSS